MLLSSLPFRYGLLEETFKYGREFRTLEEFTRASRSKEKVFGESSRRHKGQAEGLMVH